MHSPDRDRWRQLYEGVNADRACKASRNAKLSQITAQLLSLQRHCSTWSQTGKVCRQGDVVSGAGGPRLRRPLLLAQIILSSRLIKTARATQGAGCHI
jgi:hypothetical protein